jgi:WS/DGAT/MGAT family acyltransferase
MLLNDTPTTPNLICGVEIYDPSTSPGGVRFKDVLARFEQRSHISAMFTHKLLKVPFGLDFPYWIRDPNFDIEFHVRHIALPKPGDWRQFTILIARLAARPVDLSRPPWEAYVIEGLDHVEGVPTGSFALLLKLHHAAVDGQAGNEIVTAIHDEYEPPPNPDEDEEGAPSARRLLLRAGTHALARPRIAARVARSRLPALRNLPSTLRRPPGPRPSTTTTRFNGPVTAHRVWDTRYFPLADFKKIKNAVEGATINDVGMAVVGGALRDYLQQHGELPDQSMVAVMPISVRVSSDSVAAGNQIVMMQVPIGTDLDDPLARLVAVRDATTEAKSRGAHASDLMEMSELMPGALPGVAARALTSLINRAGFVAGAHTLVTNVPGPRTPLDLCGARLVKMSGVPPVFSGMGLVHGIGSYLDEIDVIFTACREMLPDPAVYAACIDASVAALLATAG